MSLSDCYANLFTEIAKSADLCLKPWKHSVVNKGDLTSKDIDNDLILSIECRHKDGERYYENDIELEIYKSGHEINLILNWINRNNDLILWQGGHSIWMDSNTGKRCNPPNDAELLESLARRIRAFWDISSAN